MANGGGIGFGGALTIVFVTLKLTNNIDWPWLWVLSPIWIGLLIVAAFLLGILGYVGIGKLLDARRRRAYRKAQVALDRRARGL